MLCGAIWLTELVTAITFLALKLFLSMLYYSSRSLRIGASGFEEIRSQTSDQSLCLLQSTTVEQASRILSRPAQLLHLACLQRRSGSLCHLIQQV